MIGITGASGNLGKAILEQLSRVGGQRPDIVACSRKPGRDLSALASETRYADFAERESLADAFRGLDTLLLVSVESSDDVRVDLHCNAINAAKAAGVRRVVYTSFFDVDPASPSFVAKVHRDTEAALMASGLSWVMLRDGPYLDNSARRMALAAKDTGLFRWSAGEAALPFISRGDLAAAAAAAILSNHDRVAFRLAGPQLLTFADLAGLVSARLGQLVTYQAISDAEFAEELRMNGLPDDLVHRRVAYAQAMRLGYMSDLNDDFYKLTGRRPEDARTALQSIDLSEPVH
ncbi:NAD(P)H-binding protein [Rhizobium puerariae]|uniref:NAD(P)H-binding protein n=1 Tax=Rhizobium puerariae TaxID=1585791 RepID=A0ABV6AKB7_9HYPH